MLLSLVSAMPRESPGLGHAWWGGLVGRGQDWEAGAEVPTSTPVSQLWQSQRRQALSTAVG